MAYANPPSVLGEPRKVRTVPIRPDQGDTAANTPVASEPVSVAPPRQVFPPPQSITSRAADVEPVAATTPPPVAPRAAAPRAPARVAARPTPAPAQAPTPTANAPLSLAPDASNDFPPPPTSPPPRAAAPTRVASAPASAGGSYLVQVTSQRSEADARSSFRSIQEKYSSVLGSQPHVVRRADLGSKGVYYRAMVGPFASREQAVQLCSSLKQAGGDCVVQH
jgi:cell division septation protein DedD